MENTPLITDVNESAFTSRLNKVYELAKFLNVNSAKVLGVLLKSKVQLPMSEKKWINIKGQLVAVMLDVAASHDQNALVKIIGLLDSDSLLRDIV